MFRGRRCRDRIVVGFTTTCAICAYHHWSCQFEPSSWRDVLDTMQCDKVCQWLVTGQWFSPCAPVSSTNKTDHGDITEIMLKVALNTINEPNQGIICTVMHVFCYYFMLFDKRFKSSILCYLYCYVSSLNKAFELNWNHLIVQYIESELSSLLSRRSL